MRLCACTCVQVFRYVRVICGFSTFFVYNSPCSSQIASAKDQSSVLKHLADGVFVLKTRYAEGVAFDIENTSKAPVRVDLTLTEAESMWMCACTSETHSPVRVDITLTDTAQVCVYACDV